MHGLMADGAGGAWTFGGSILTAVFPMILFIVVAVGLYVLYTKPEFVPGHPAPGLERPVSYTAVPRPPAVDREAPAPPTTAGMAETPAAGTAAATHTAETTETPSGEAAQAHAAQTEDTE